MDEPQKPTHPLASAGGIAAAIAGWSVSQYCGASFWIPGAAAILLVILFVKTAFRPKFFKGAIIATGAHVAWFIIGSFITGIWTATLADIVILLTAIVWLWLRPGLAPAIFLGAVQLVCLGLNLISLSASTFGDIVHRALTAHCLFRLLAIFCLVLGYIRLRKGRSAGDTVSPPMPAS